SGATAAELAAAVAAVQAVVPANFDGTVIVTITAVSNDTAPGGVEVSILDNSVTDAAAFTLTVDPSVGTPTLNVTAGLTGGNLVVKEDNSATVTLTASVAAGTDDVLKSATVTGLETTSTYVINGTTVTGQTSYSFNFAAATTTSPITISAAGPQDSDVDLGTIVVTVTAADGNNAAVTADSSPVNVPVVVDAILDQFVDANSATASVSGSASVQTVSLGLTATVATTPFIGALNGGADTDGSESTTATITLGAALPAGGSLSLASGASITLVAVDSTTYTLTGTASQVQDALTKVQVTLPGGFTGAVTGTVSTTSTEANTPAGTVAGSGAEPVTTDNTYTDPTAATFSVTLTNAAPIVLDTHNWMPSDPAQQTPGYTNGYPLLVTVPTDADGNNLLVTATGTIPAGTFYFDGLSYVAVTTGLVLYDTANSINLLDDLVYRPTAAVTDTVNVALALDVFDGTVHVTQTVNVHEVPPTSIPGPTGSITGDSNNPLTSGNNADADFVLSSVFAAAVNNDPSAGSITLRTDFQGRNGYNVPIQPADQNGNSLEAQVNVYIYVDGIKFQAVSTADGNPNTWLFDGQLMKTTVDFDNIVNTTNPSQTLAQYIAANPVAAGETWTIQYDDITPGNDQARQLTFSLEVFDPGNPSITVNGDATLPDLIYGGSGSDTLSGNGGNDTIIGRAGNDIITGGAGVDTLTGGTGSDHFRYNAPTEGDDHIIDFSSAEGDTIDIALAGFTGAGLSLGTITAAQFGSSGDDTFGSADERFHYNTNTNALLYDADGAGGGAAVTLAILDNAAALAAANIQVVS
ncbi:MAG: hypothetical protein Q8R73_24005, partial [Bradyrhizobium sp.]|nr:hypothetical protein [Bradyrhizobium sp.]